MVADVIMVYLSDDLFLVGNEADRRGARLIRAFEAAASGSSPRMAAARA